MKNTKVVYSLWKDGKQYNINGSPLYTGSELDLISENDRRSESPQVYGPFDLAGVPSVRVPMASNEELQSFIDREGLELVEVDSPFSLFDPKPVWMGGGWELSF